jgi:hypothetical protein
LRGETQSEVEGKTAKDEMRTRFGGVKSQGAVFVEDVEGFVKGGGGGKGIKIYEELDSMRVTRDA